MADNTKKPRELRVKLPADVHRRLSLYSFTHDMNYAAFLESAIEAYAEKHGGHDAIVRRLVAAREARHG